MPTPGTRPPAHDPDVCRLITGTRPAHDGTRGTRGVRSVVVIGVLRPRHDDVVSVPILRIRRLLFADAFIVNGLFQRLIEPVPRQRAEPLPGRVPQRVRADPGAL